MRKAPMEKNKCFVVISIVPAGDVVTGAGGAGLLSSSICEFPNGLKVGLKIRAWLN